MKRASCLILIGLIFLPVCVHAEIRSITASHTYQMGDNDSRNDARHLCFLEAKRKVLEKAGSYIESQTTVKNYQLTKDEISSYSAALLEVETVGEKWEKMVVTLTVKAKVDTSYIEKQLARIQNDTSVQSKIKKQQAKLKELERQVSALQKQLASVNAVEAASLRKERNVTFKLIDILELKKIEIVEKVRTRSRDAKQYIEPGMTREDVISLIGDPDGKSGYVWYYGTTRVCFITGWVVNRVE